MLSDQELIHYLKSNDRKTFKELVLSYQDKVINTCFGFVQDEEDARDLAQEVFVEIFLSIRHFRADASISTWIYRIAVNKSLDWLKRKNRKKRFAILERIRWHDRQDSAAIQESASSPDEALDQKQRRILLRDALQKLPENQRIAITLFHFEGISQTEIAGIMKTTVGAVESLLFRGKRKLRDRMREG